MEMPRFTAAPWTASLTTGRHLVGGALHVGVVSAVALEARVHTCIPRFCGISSNAPHLSKRPTCFTGRECCDWQVCVWPWHRGTTATARLRENGPVHGWANGRAASKQSNDGVAGTQWWYTSMLWASSADGSMRHGRTTALSYAPRGRGGHNEPAQAPLRALWAALSLSLRAVAAAAERDTVECAAHAARTMLLLPCCRAARMPARSRRGPWRRRAGPRIPARFALGLAML
jgi:hypothetical protein